MERFNAELALDLIERHRITGFIAATPMLQRMAQAEASSDRDLSSLGWVQQGAAPLPRGSAAAGSTSSGPEHFYMSYGSSEQIGLVVCRGDEWLAHPGTLGRGMNETEVRILGPDGADAAARRDRRHLPPLAHRTAGHRTSGTTCRRWRRPMTASTRWAISAGWTRTASSTWPTVGWT